MYDGRLCERMQVRHPGRYFRRHLDFQRYWQTYSYASHMAPFFNREFNTLSQELLIQLCFLQLNTSLGFVNPGFTYIKSLTEKPGASRHIISNPLTNYGTVKSRIYSPGYTRFYLPRTPPGGLYGGAGYVKVFLHNKQAAL